ncbi:hypothetical protein Baya_8286 [Bagarius yarrelli]|uniref:Uncharacterized protein n=1 Tax=Bagarius yarrelli TaxID=175774 RepID=A0A556U3R5_BAGYA|nr:hypothetical protein Baya_8286 [Bagarius yarrelli]
MSVRLFSSECLCYIELMYTVKLCRIGQTLGIIKPGRRCPRASLLAEAFEEVAHLDLLSACPEASFITGQRLGSRLRQADIQQIALLPL